MRTDDQNRSKILSGSALLERPPSSASPATRAEGSELKAGPARWEVHEKGQVVFYMTVTSTYKERERAYRLAHHIYRDSGYDRRMPGLFEYAACVLAHVMDRPTRDLLTLNLGHKRWGIDNGPIEVFSEPGLEFVSASEEHTVLRIDPSRGGDVSNQIGAPVLLVPRHVCSSVNLWETFVVLGPDGSIEDPASPVDGRNR